MKNTVCNSALLGVAALACSERSVCTRELFPRKILPESRDKLTQKGCWGQPDYPTKVSK